MGREEAFTWRWFLYDRAHVCACVHAWVERVQYPSAAAVARGDGSIAEITVSCVVTYAYVFQVLVLYHRTKIDFCAAVLNTGE